MKPAFTDDQRVMWRELRHKNATVQAVLAEAERLTPRSFSDAKDHEIARVALTSAHTQGWRDCLAMIESLAEDKPGNTETPFMPTHTDL